MRRMIRSDPREEAGTDRARPYLTRLTRPFIRLLRLNSSSAMTHARKNRVHDASNFDDFMLAAVSAMLIAAALVV